MSCERSVTDTRQAPAEKALTEVVRFYIDYTDDLAEVSPADTLASSSWAIEGTLVEETEGNTDQVAYIKVSGGTKIGSLHRLTNTVVTAQGETWVRTLTVKIVNIHAKRPDEAEVEFTTPTPI